MSCTVMFQPALSADSLRQRLHQQNNREEILHHNICNNNNNRSASSENTLEKYTAHISCLTNTKMFQDQKHIPVPNKYNNAEGELSLYNDKGTKHMVNYVLVKNYAGDVESVVDEHFSRALEPSRKTSEFTKDRATTARQFPPSYYQPFREGRQSYNHGSSNRYHPYGSIPTSDWTTISAQEYKGIAHRGMYTESYPQFGASLPYQYALQSLQQPISKMAANEFHSQTKPEGWTSRHESVNIPYYQENIYDPTYLSPVHNGIDSSTSQDYPKDFYWL